MRRTDRQISEDEALVILEQGEYGVLAMIDADGAPYALPVNYAAVGRKVYFHCAVEGTKIDALEAHPEASFCVVGDTEVLPESFGTRYESCIVRGPVTEASGDEKQAALEALIRKYSADYYESGMRYIDKMTARTRVFGIAMDEVTGKAQRK